MAKIEFENKQALNENANIPDINKVKDSDLNEIKNVVNQTILNSLFGVYYDSWQSSETYSIGDIVIYDAILYENLTGTNTETTPDQDSTNWQVVNILLNSKVNPKLIDKTNFIKNTSNNSQTDTYSCNYINGIIESGANANGYYTKYADGTLICRYYVGPLTTEPYSSATLNVTFPSTFSNNEYSCCVSFLDPQAYWGSVNVGCRNKTTTGFTMETWNSSNGQNPNQWFNYIAIGRWK